MREILKEASDELLAERIAESASERMCEELYSRYKRKVYLWCFRYVNNTDDALDLSQEVFIKVFSNIASFKGQSSFSSWVYSVARNHCLGNVTRKKSKIWSEALPLKEEILNRPGGGGGTNEIEIRKDLEAILEFAGSEIKEDELQAFIMRYWEGLRVKEVTRVMGCENISGARTLIQNARRKFARLIEKKGLDDEY